MADKPPKHASHAQEAGEDYHGHVPEKELHLEDKGYHKGLKARQLQMIAMGGAIGTGLFMGAGGRLAQVGPSLIFVYALCGFFAFLVLRALGELVVYRPSSGSFVSYAREFYGEKFAFVSGWLYWIDWVTTAVADATAAALYMHFFSKYWAPIADVPQWGFALGALALVFSLNMIAVEVFGEMEFWFALIKVSALICFLLVGTWLVIFGTPVPGHEVGFRLIAENGGWFPNSILPAVLMIQGVIFAYGSIELIGTAAGETKNPRKEIPRAINTVILRIVIFYVGSVFLLSLLLPYSAYKAGESPFVTFFASIGVKGVDIIMNMVVLTAALSSLNAGLYSTGRILRSLSTTGSAPQFASKLSKSGVPYGGIVLTASVALIGIALNAIVPSQAFEIMLNLAAIGIISAWMTIVLCQIRLVSWSKKGLAQRPAFRMFGAPYTGYLTLVFLTTVLVLMAFDYPVGTWTIASMTLVAPALVIGWFLCRDRIKELAAKYDPTGKS